MPAKSRNAVPIGMALKRQRDTQRPGGTYVGLAIRPVEAEIH